MDIIKEIESVEEFNEIMKSNSPKVLKFWAEWCGPCKMLKPHIERLANEYNERVSVFAVNVDNLSEIAAKYNVSSIPTLVLTKDGSSYNDIVGAIPYNKIKETVEHVFFTEDKSE